MKLLNQLAESALDGRRLVMLTAYDALFAAYASEADVDVLLVGDSLGMVVQGHGDTLRVSVDQIAYHTECVARGNRDCVVVADMPFGSYQTSPEDAMRAAATLMRAGAHAVKLEGGRPMAPTVRFLVERGVPVLGHIGLTPQSVHVLGGFRVQGRSDDAIAELHLDRNALADAGACMVVVECVPASTGARLAEESTVPIIGIGAGPAVHGQVMVLPDILGWTRHLPRFARNFAWDQNTVEDSIAAYVAAARQGAFPDTTECY